MIVKLRWWFAAPLLFNLQVGKKGFVTLLREKWYKCYGNALSWCKSLEFVDIYTRALGGTQFNLRIDLKGEQ
jgi:hypothetical protein